MSSSRRAARVLAATFAAALVGALGAPAAHAEQLELAVQTSLVAPVLRGASIGGRLRFESHPHLAIGAGVYALSVPQAMIDGSSQNEFEDWHVDVRPAVHVSADYFVRPDGSGFAAGIIAGIARFSVTSDIVAGRTAFLSAFATPRAAYTWFLSDRWFVHGWFGVQLDGQVAGSTQLGTRRFSPFGVQAQANLEVGVVFEP